MTIHHYFLKKSFLQACYILEMVNFLWCLNFPLTDIISRVLKTHTDFLSVLTEGWSWVSVPKHIVHTLRPSGRDNAQTVLRRQKMRNTAEIQKPKLNCSFSFSKGEPFLTQIVLTMCVCHHIFYHELRIRHHRCSYLYICVINISEFVNLCLYSGI